MAEENHRNPSDAIPNLTELVIREVFINFGLKQTGPVANLLSSIMYRPAREFAKVLSSIDHDASTSGLHGAASNVLHHFVTRLEIRGWESPKEGPLLVVSNHPGGTDPFVLASAIDRRDLHFLSQEHIVFDTLPNLKRFLVCTAEDRSDGHLAIRRIMSLLKKQQTVLIYPGGELELDPSIFQGTNELLRDWSQSVALILSRMPDVIVQPVVLRGTISMKAWKSWLTRIGKEVTTRLQIAMITQIAIRQLKQDAYPVETTLIKGMPLRARDLSSDLNPDDIHRAVMDTVHGMLRADPLQFPFLEEIIPAT